MQMLAQETRLDQNSSATAGRSLPQGTGRARMSGRLPVKPTQGELEASICDGMKRFELEYVGRGPRDARAHLIGNLLVVCLNGVMTESERRLAASPDPRGCELVRQMRSHLFDLARPLIEAMIEMASGVKVVSLHYDISLTSDEVAILFTLAAPPELRERDVRRRQFPAVG